MPPSTLDQPCHIRMGLLQHILIHITIGSIVPQGIIQPTYATGRRLSARFL
jgi:hypothetical protein